MSSWKAAIATAALALSTVACSRQPAVETLDDAASNGQRLPFERVPNRKGLPPALTVAEVPAGTPIAIRLKSSLSSATARAGESFEAVLDEPVVVHGKVVIPRGAIATGRIVAAKPSDGQESSGYVRLALSAITMNGKSQPIQTSSIFAKGGAREFLSSNLATDSNHPITIGIADVQFAPAHRFTFRLKEAIAGQP